MSILARFFEINSYNKTMFNHPVILSLERQRLKLCALQFALNDAFNLLDQGDSTSEQKTETQQTIQELQTEAQQAETIFENTIQHIIKTRPKLIVNWANQHIRFYLEIINELKQETPPNTTFINIAEETIEQWQDVIQDKKYYVMDNPYLIKNYESRQQTYFGLVDEE
ncbi:MAG: hypothetical protein CL609_20140 [Anaerolineaceae bacterium]|nr:hypothetical protein [Anaerolineaceae bacterium]